MTAPTAPYLTTDLLALLQKNLLLGLPDFTSGTALPKTTIEQYIVWISAQIDLKFIEAGYKVPFVETTTWPTHQTYFLQLITAVGVSSLMAMGLKPAPAVGPGNQGSPLNEYEKRFQLLLTQIYNGKKATRWSADYYLGTAAEVAVTEPTRPKSNFMEGYLDKSNTMGLDDYTDMMKTIFDGVIATTDKWDYMYDLTGMGYGY